MRNVFLLVTTLAIGCAEVTEFANIQPIVLRGEPMTSSYLDPSADFSKYRTFSVFPYSAISETDRMNPIMEKQILFLVRSQMEQMGYEFVRITEQPDVLVTAYVESPYSETYVPPEQVSTRVWKPGKVITAQANTSGTLSLNSYSQLLSNTWGTYSESTTTTTYVPGHIATETSVRPGYTLGYYYPAASVRLYDRATLENVWLGVGVGTSANADARIASQVVLSELIGKLPACSTGPEKSSGVVGINFRVITADGNNYYPVVFDMPAASPAKRSGIRKFDRITAVNGSTTHNKTFAEVAALLRGNAGDDVTLEVARAGQRAIVATKRVDRAVLGW